VIWAAALLIVCGLARAEDARLARVLSRLAEEAEAFRTNAPNALAQETLRQRARKGPSRFRPRIGAAATRPQEVKWQTREIVSEYTYAAFRDSPDTLHEFRQVVSVDGRRVTTSEKARQKLAEGMRSSDDRLKRWLLEHFEKHGLQGAAADFGQIILLFEKRRQDSYQFQAAGDGRIGADAAARYRFRQEEGEGMTIFEGRRVIRKALEGEIWARHGDWLPLRVVLRVSRQRGEETVADEATVDYVMTQHGFLAPASVVHRQTVASQLVVENLFQYSPFRRFAADTDIKFTEVPMEVSKER